MDFLYRKENALSANLCNTFINLFEQSPDLQPGVLHGPDGPSSISDKKSTDLTFNPSYLRKPGWENPLNEFIPILLRNFEIYVERNITAFQKLDPIELYTYFNMQRYLPGEGFSGWHCERASTKFLNRVLVWMVYLNTVTDRGETEFLYQQHFESAVQGKLIIWPSDWMYTHRGVSSPTETKYVLTGWFIHPEKK